MTEAFPTFIAAARACASTVEERRNDELRSFLEATLEDAIAQHLPGQTETTQQRHRWAVKGFDPFPYGVDIDWRHAGVHAGVEVKVSDALDSLFDVVKLATALAHGLLDEGYCAVAADPAHWAGGGAFTTMTSAPRGHWRCCPVEQLLAPPQERDAVLVSKGPRPHTVPAQVETMSVEPIEMPRAPTHTLRLLAVRPATGATWVELPRRGV